MIYMVFSHKRNIFSHLGMADGIVETTIRKASFNYFWFCLSLGSRTHYKVTSHTESPTRRSLTLKQGLRERQILNSLANCKNSMSAKCCKKQFFKLSNLLSEISTSKCIVQTSRSSRRLERRS